MCRDSSGQNEMEKLIDDKSVKAFGELLSRVSRVLLTCHVRPDGDAIGSTLGLMHLLKSIGKDATVLLPDAAPRNLSFLPGFREMAVYTVHPEFSRQLVADAELIICCDFNKPSRQDALEELISASSSPKVMIDHHQFPDDFAAVTFSYPEMSSACEVAFRVVAALGLYTEINKECATCLLTGIITDTRNFSVNLHYPDIYEILMRLLEKGVDKVRLVREALETRSYWSLRLEAFALSQRMEILPQHAAAITTLSQHDLADYHYERGDSEGLVNRPLEIRGVICSFFLREDKDCVKVSARSVNNYPVSEICEDLFGGGGHRMAAGAEFHGSLEGCRKRLVESLANYDKYLPTRRDKIEI